MSFEEISSLLKESTKKLYEKERLQCYFNLISQGSKIKSPQDVVLFEWEKKTKSKPKELTKNQVDKKAKEAEQWLEKMKQA
jgi:hypothetical protein